MKMPFTPEQFLNVFERYNHAIFPGQFFILALGILSIVLIHIRRTSKNMLIGSILGLLWIWAGAVYHLLFFAEINPVARLFGAVFILEGLLIFYAALKNRLRFTFSNKSTDYIGYFFILFGIIVYPLIGYFLQAEPSIVISLGLPCPTTLFTFGFFIMARNHFPKYLLIIPTLWAVIGLSAAVNFGVYQDFMLLIAAVSALLIIFIEKKLSLKYERSM